MSQFAFVQRGWPDVFDTAVRAETSARADPRTSCFYARRALENYPQLTADDIRACLAYASEMTRERTVQVG